MNWTPLTTAEQLDALDAASHHGPVLIFKHSTRCSISGAALNRLESSWTPADPGASSVHYLDLLKYRSLSNAIADRYAIEHESPQALLIHDGRCVHVRSHFEITYADTVAAFKRLDGPGVGQL
ncbi:MAG: bacillithiol system redox-active protein YtxJ [Flavobacteriales bacterium]|nr:bacillithiol system redox-active protein YtxJ [Flavobacteriales bacterium]